MTQVLLIEDELALARSIHAYLTRHGYEVSLAENAEKGLALHQNSRPAITLLDYQLGKIDGLEVLQEIRRVDKDAQVVMMTGHGHIQLAVNAMKAGARDFLTKPVPLSTLKDVVEQFTNTDSLKPPCQLPESGLDAIVGRSAAVNELKRAVEQIIVGFESSNGCPAPILITGEPGTGKELIAKALHTDGPRKHKKFVLVDCLALSDNKFEKSVFGYRHEKGRTPSGDDPNFLMDADGGVLFFDEISQLSLPLQANLLRLLDDVSSQNSATYGERPFDIWFLSSTNRSLAALTQEGAFNRGLFFRLQSVLIEAPALRHRDSDILFLAEHFLAKMTLYHSLPRRELTPQARAKLVDHNWPGNVRELQYVMECACLLADGEKIGAKNVNFPELGKPTNNTLLALPEEGLPLETVEQSLLSQALERTNWNVSKAAGLLGLSRDQMRYRIQKFRLKHQI